MSSSPKKPDEPKFLCKDGTMALDQNDEIVASILTTIDGEVVHAGAREAMGM